MKIRSFLGGIHPNANKTLTRDKEIVSIAGSKIHVFPLSKHIGAPSVPEVAVGERVLVGQLIAKAGGFVGENIHSSVSGKVKAIEARPTDNGTKILSIVVENDELNETVEGFGITAARAEAGETGAFRVVSFKRVERKRGYRR